MAECINSKHDQEVFKIGDVMRKALIVGINYYKHGNALHGCVDDAHAVKAVLEHHDGGSDNFDCLLLTGTGSSDSVNRSDLKDSISDLFKTDSEIALFYFSGYGHIEATDGHLLTTDSAHGDEGVSLYEILTIANNSPAKNKIIILDSCHSGIAGTPPESQGVVSLSDGLTILTASTEDQYATEENGCGIFTTLFVDALGGSAANLSGDITPGSIYAHIDQFLGNWEQRPVFKTNVREFVSIKKVQPPISTIELSQLVDRNRI